MTAKYRARAVALSAIILISMVAGGTVVSGTAEVEDEATGTAPDSITQEGGTESSINYGTNLSKAVRAVSTSDQVSSATADSEESSAVTAQNAVIQNKIASDDEDSLSDLSSADPVRLQLKFSDSADVSETVAEIEEMGTVLRQFDDIGYASVLIELGDVPRIERIDGVETVRLEPTASRADTNEQHATPDNQSASRQEPSHAWESMNSYSDADLLHDVGYNGSGATVAVIDTGVTETDALSGKIADQRDFTTGAQSDAFDPTGTDPTDYFGHGSNVAGIIAASDTVVEAENRTEVANGNRISTSNSETYETEGVAPGANLLNAKVFQLLETNRGGPVTETLGTNERGRVDINNFDQNAQYLRVEAEWADPNDNVTVELVDPSGNVVDTAFDGNGYELSPETTEFGNKTVIHLNTTGGMFNSNIDAVRLTGDSVSGETDVNVTYRQFDDLAYSGDIAEAIEWSTTGTDAGAQASSTADVISTSIGASGSQPVREAAIEQAVENGSLYVSSAGNAGGNTDISSVKQRDDVITVGAIDRDGSIAEFSQPGPSENKPDLVAPGVAIPSAGAPDRLPAVAGFDNNGTVKSGTSMSTPYVSGAAALYIDAYRDMHGTNPSPEEIKAALTAGAVDSREDPAFDSAGSPFESFSAQPADLPLADGRDDRYGAGTVNPYNSYVAFVASGQGDETVTVDTDGLTTVPSADQSARNARPQKAVLSWVDGTSDYGLSSSTAGSASGPGAERIIVETASGQTTTYSISETASGSDEWAFGVTAPILDEQAQGWSGDGYDVTAEPGQSLEANESAAYAVPVDRTLVTGSYADDIGPIRVQSYENGSGDLDLYLYDGNGSLEDKSIISEPDVEQVIGDNQTAAQGGSASKVVFASNFSNGSSAFTAVHNYPLEPLPSEASVTVTDSVAGNASDPGSVALEFTVETAGRPYSYSGFGQPDESHVEVAVGNHTVNNVTLSEADGREDKYRVEFVAPMQQTTGDYDVSISFTDEKYGTSHTAETTAANAIEYTEGGGATGSTATAIIIDESGSMTGNKIQNAKQSAEEYVSLLGPGDYATVVGFASGARTPAPMQRTTTANKSDLKNGIDELSAGGGTDIGDGMNEAFPEFDKAPENTTKAAILLGDGRASYPNNQVQTYNNSDVPVCTIALGSDADRDTLERIAENTGCELREASSSNLQEIYNELNQNITGSSTIDKKEGTVNNNSTAKQRFRLDRSVDNTNVRVNIGSSSGSSADASTAVTANDGATTVRLLYPNGTVVPLNSSSPTGTDDPSITYNDLGDTTIYQLDNPEAGEWTTEIRNQQSSPVSYSSEVTASASATLSATTDGSEFVNGSTTTVSATLVNDQGGISGATVTANVTQPDGSTDTIQLNETSSGTYRGQIVNEDNGTVSATVTAASQNFSRETSLSWSVVDQSSVLQTSIVNNTTATTAEGGSVDVAVNVTRPADGSSTSATVSTDASAETDTAESAFMAQVREVAASEPGTYDPADVDPAVLTAARALQNESNQATMESINETLAATDATSSVSATTSDSAKPVFVSASELTAPSGATIPGSAVQTSPSVVSLQTGAAAEVTVSVQVPDSASPGVYNGTVTAVIDGSVVQTAYTVNVTEATAATYESRIQQSASNWAATTSPNGKSYYETQIADQLTNRYFEVDSGSGSTDSDDESTTADAIGGVNVGVIR